MNRGRTWGILTTATVSVTAACVDITGQFGGGQLSFDRLPAPSVVVGDTLRDILGQVAPLEAIVTEGRTLRFVPLDTNIRVDAAGFLTARSRDTAAAATNIVRVIADAGGRLQTPPQTLVVTVRPDQVVRVKQPAVLAYDPNATGTVADTLNRSVPLEVRVRHFFVAGEKGAAARDTVVRAYHVQFRVEAAPSVLDSARTVSDLGTPYSLDTTDASGLASRRVRVYPAAGASASDSIVVRVHVRYRGGDIDGSPVRFVVPLRRR